MEALALLIALFLALMQFKAATASKFRLEWVAEVRKAASRLLARHAEFGIARGEFINLPLTQKDREAMIERGVFTAEQLEILRRMESLRAEIYEFSEALLLLLEDEKASHRRAERIVEIVVGNAREMSDAKSREEFLERCDEAENIRKQFIRAFRSMIRDETGKAFSPFPVWLMRALRHI